MLSCPRHRLMLAGQSNDNLEKVTFKLNVCQPDRMGAKLFTVEQNLLEAVGSKISQNNFKNA